MLLTSSLAIDPVKQRSEDLPGDVQLVITDKVGVVPFESVKDKSLVCLRDFGVGESFLIGEVELDWDRSSCKTGQLCIHFHVNSLGWLNSKDELIAGDVVEDTLCGIFELDPDLHLALVQR